MIICKECGNEFSLEGRAHNTIYCSKKCGNKARGDVDYKRNSEKIKERVRNYNHNLPIERKKEIQDKKKKHRLEISKWYSDYKSTLSCVICGESNRYCIDFHHKDLSTKIYPIAKMVNRSCRRSRILEEIRKCIVLCANCHRKLHGEEKQNKDCG